MNIDTSDYKFKIFMHTGIAGFSYLLMKKCFRDYLKQQEEIEKVKNEFHKIQEYDPDQLRHQLKHQYKKEKKSKQIIDCGRYFVRGVVSCDQPLTSFKNHHVKLIYSNYTKHDLVAKVKENKVLDHSRSLNSSNKQYVSRFELRGNKNKKGKCYVENIKKSRLGDVVQFIASEETSLFPTLHVASMGVGSVVKIGFDQNEYGIKVGEQITVYGKVLYDTVNKIIKFEDPKNILANKEEYEKYLDEFSYSLLCALIFGGLLAYEAYNFGMAIKSIFVKKNKNY